MKQAAVPANAEQAMEDRRLTAALLKTELAAPNLSFSSTRGPAFARLH
ncbi:hypothetical protein [Haloferula helveola]